MDFLQATTIKDMGKNFDNTQKDALCEKMVSSKSSSTTTKSLLGGIDCTATLARNKNVGSLTSFFFMIKLNQIKSNSFRLASLLSKFA